MRCPTRFHIRTTSLATLYEWFSWYKFSIFPILFANDTNLFNRGKDLSSLQVSLNKELAEISRWLKVLSLNIKKLNIWYLLVTKPDHPYMDLRNDDENICQTKLSKFLGVYIDCKLNWKTHINYVWGKIARGVGILVKARKISVMRVWKSYVMLLCILI